MERSIENIWKEGFLTEDAIVAPKVNDLYNRKSQHIIDKMMRMMHINIIAIWIFAFAFFAYALIIKMPLLLGLFVTILFAIVGLYSKAQLKKVQHLDQNVNSYQYLRQFDSWLKKGMSRNAQLARYFYPTCFLAASLMIWFAKGRGELLQKLLEKYPDMIMISGVPLYFILGVSLITILMTVFARKIYRWDINLVYGRVFKKLHEMINDMEELRK